MVSEPPPLWRSTAPPHFPSPSPQLSSFPTGFAQGANAACYASDNTMCYRKPDLPGFHVGYTMEVASGPALHCTQL